jgi:hypothetical protein
MSEKLPTRTLARNAMTLSGVTRRRKLRGAPSAQKRVREETGFSPSAFHTSDAGGELGTEQPCVSCIVSKPSYGCESSIDGARRRADYFQGGSG